MLFKRDKTVDDAKRQQEKLSRAAEEAKKIARDIQKLENQKQMCENNSKHTTGSNSVYWDKRAFIIAKKKLELEEKLHKLMH